MFNKGQVYKRKDLHDLYGGNRQSGICPSRKSDVIFLFTGESGKEHGYEDGWVNDTFYYTGEGQIGDMKFGRGNKAIRDHIQNGKSLHLFQQLGNGSVKYSGELNYRGHQIRDGLDRNKHNRKIIVFELTK